ncbi:hypothetical protein CRYUN_Cryun05aG0070000 [Craigia yunnanensis]
MNQATDSSNSQVSVEDASKAVPSSPINDVQINAIAWKGWGIDAKTLENVETSGEVNIEVSITAEDVVRAGALELGMT